MTPSRCPAILPLVAVIALAGQCGCSPSTGNAAAAAAPTVQSGRKDGAERHPVTIRPGPPTPVAQAAAAGPDGRPVAVACSTCHATRPPNRSASSGEALREFHRGLGFAHGGLTCLSCHNASNYDTLRLADGASLDYPQVIRLCAQCHGPQYRNYRHGTHGGMNGHWDLARGPRTRNTCVDCHDPHAPAYPRVRPVFPPKDRGVRDPDASAAKH